MRERRRIENFMEILDKEAKPFSKGFLVAIGGYGAPMAIMGAKSAKQEILGLTAVGCSMLAVAIAHDLLPFIKEK